MNVAHESENPKTGNATQQTLPFEAHHIKYLEERDVVPGWAAYAGLRAVDAEEGARLLGLTKPLSSGGLFIPYPDESGYGRIRLDEGDVRFLASVEREVPVYLPPGFRPEGSEVIYVVEGPIKALALVDRGFNALGLGGTATTLMVKGGVRRPNGSWVKVDLQNRRVVLVFDSNRSTNPNVARDEARLALALEQSGANVTLAMLPLREDGQDQGPDDFLATHGATKFEQVVAAAIPADPIKWVERIVSLLAGEERKKAATNLLADFPFLAAVKERGQVAQMRVIDVLKPFGLKSSMLGCALKEMAALLKAKNKSIETASTNSKYVVHEGQFCKPSRIGDTGSPEPICNFTARIVEQEIVDDGAEKTRHFVIEGALASGAPLPRVRVTPQEFAGELWPSEKWGARPIIYADISRAAGHLRAAIQTISDPVETVTYMHSGFREHGGKWIYLHAGGAVGAPEVIVDLEGPFRRYKLPAFAEDPVEAVKLSLGLLATANKRITLPLHCAIYRAPLQELLYCDAMLALHGKSGSMKSSLAAIAQSHWGDVDHMTLPLSWGSTASAIELHLFRMKDTLITIDDFVPKSADLMDEQHKKAAQVIRAIGNGSARSRLRSDCTARADRPCRGLVLSTGEDLPKGESVQARLVALRVAKEDIHLDALTRLQADKHRLPHAMVAYIQWISSRMGQLKTEVEKKFREFRDEMQQKHGHLRAAAAMAHLLVGAYYFTEFAKDLGALSDEDAERHLDETRAALLANYREQVLATEQSNPGRRFLEVLRDLLLRRKVALKPMGMSLKSSSDDNADVVGWEDKTHAILLPDAAFEAVNKALKSMNEGTPLQQYGLWSRMAEEGLVLPNGKEPTHRLEVDNRRVRVLKIELATLRGEPDPDGSDDGGPASAGLGDKGEREDGVDGTPSSWRPLRGPAMNTNDSSAGVAAASATSSPVAQGPGSHPVRSGQVGGGTAQRETPSNPQFRGEGDGSDPLSAQMPRCSRGESPSKGTDVATRSNSSSLDEESAPLQGNRATGQAGQSPLAEAVLRAGRVGLAVRSTGPDLFSDGPRLLAIALPNGETHVIDLLEEEPGPLVDVLPQVTIIGHDLKVALAHLQHHLGIEPGAVIDTSIAAKLLDGGVHLGDEKYFSFASACQLVFNIKPENRPGINWFGPLGPERLDDAAQEAHVVLQLEQVMRKDLAMATLEEVADLEFKLLPILVQMELTGVPVDRARWEWELNMRAAEAAALKKTLTVELGVQNVDNNSEVLTALRRLGLPVEFTSGEALAPYMHIPAVQHLTRYRPLNSFVTGAGNGVLRALKRSADGRVHATLNQIGATGRMSADHPNMMGLPRDPRIRACVTASPGKKLVIGDYTTIELRVLADQTGDEQLKEVFRTGGDPHRHTASLVMGVSEDQVTEEQRRRAKAPNFGVSFGMGKNKLIAYARKSYGVELTSDEAEQFKQKLLENYAGISKWQKKTQKQMAPELRTESGRTCCFFDPDGDYNARLAFPIQGTAADGMKMSMILLHPHLKKLGAKIILAVHDELLVEAPEEHADAVKEIMRAYMVAGMAMYVKTVPIIVEPEVKKSWRK